MIDLASKSLKKSEKTRASILDATARCISKIGVEKTSITQIADEAGTSRALVAHYFPKKDEMFLEVIRHLSRKFAESAKPLEGVSKLESSIRANLDFFLDAPEHFNCFFLLYYYASIHQHFREMNTRMTEQTIARFMTEIQELRVQAGRPIPTHVARELASALQRELTGSIQQYYVLLKTHPADQIKERILESCLAIALEN